MGYTDGKVLGSDEGIKLGSTDGKIFVIILGNGDGITLGLDVGTELLFLDGSFDGSNDCKLEVLLIGDSLLSTDGTVLGSDEGTARAILTRLGVHVVVGGLMFGGIGCHAMSKGEELSCEIYYHILFLSLILACKYPHFVEIPRFHGYNPHFV